MALPSFARDTVTVMRASRIVERGVEIYDWDQAETHDIPGCSVQFTTTALNGVLSANKFARDSLMTRAILYMPPGSDIQKGDRIIFNGDRYLIDGAPYEMISPTGRLTHIKCNLVDWEG